ncbi:DUF4158 domain-containing protein [Streptomyces sp. NPDC018057]|uniref:DUF4158 domain-containing protein n=1 Tax=unclassified Streptomyces TaxID=2593676 RepID=UPI003789EB13
MKRELREFFTPSAEDVVWAREYTHDRPGRVLALLVMLKSAARLGRAPKLGEIPEVVVAHLLDQAGLAAGTVPEADLGRSEERHRSVVRERLRLRHEPGEARAVAEAAMRAAAPLKAHTADLLNVALKELVRHKERLELLAFSTLDRMASRICSEVDASQCEAIVAGEYRACSHGSSSPPGGRHGRDSERMRSGWRGWTGWGCRLLGGEDTADEGGRAG